MTSPYLERIRRSEAEVLTAIKAGAAGKESTKLKAINADLLAALTEMMREFEPDQAEYDDGENYNPPDWLVLARAAIAKAKKE